MVDDKRNVVAPKAFGSVRSGFVRFAPRCAAPSRLRTAMARLGTVHPRARGTHAFTLPKQRDPESVRGFTLVELLVSVSVVVLLVFLTTQLINSAATVTTLGNKVMDSDSQAREVFDRMAFDVAQMVKRSDVDYYLKTFGIGPFTNQNDQIAFYSNASGYYPSSSSQSPVSLVGYRVNSDPSSPAYNRMERLGKGLVWNGAATGAPMVFLPQTISGAWPFAVSTSTADPTYEVIGPQVFRFEYYYLRTGGFLSDQPSAGNTASAMREVTAIVVDLAVIDPRSRALLTEDQITSFNTSSLSQPSPNFLQDFSSDQNQPGQFLSRKWRTKVNTLISASTTTLPREALKGIRLYERYLYLPPRNQ